MKRWKIIFILCCVLCLCGCAKRQLEKDTKESVLGENIKKKDQTFDHKVISDHKKLEDDNLEEELASEKSFFFPEGTQSVKYRTKFLLFVDGEPVPSEAEIIIKKIKKIKTGDLYQLKICCDGIDSYQDVYEVERFDLGYFFVQGDSIYRISRENKDKLELADSEEDVVSQGILVCQKENADDPNRKEYINVNRNRYECLIKDDLSENGYFESFIWERGRGLVEYCSGYTDMTDLIEIQMVTDR